LFVKGRETMGDLAFRKRPSLLAGGRKSYDDVNILIKLDLEGSELLEEVSSGPAQHEAENPPSAFSSMMIYKTQPEN